MAFPIRSVFYRTPAGNVIFCFHENELVALSAFVKKTQQTPQSELGLALDRKKELER
jgi:phage-related protein